MEQKKHSHTGHRQRFKTKAYEDGIRNWPAHEVMELILMYCIPQKDVNPLAHDLINRFGSIANVLDAGYEELIKVDGVGHETALFLSLLPDMFDRYKASKNTDGVKLDTIQKCVDYFRTITHIRNKEELYVLCLNNKGKLIKTFLINQGNSSSVSFSIKNFSNQILFPNNHSVVVMHSHPNGDCRPTSADISATRRLVHACFSVGINMLDHIIVSQFGYFSFDKDGLLKTLKQEASDGINYIDYLSKINNKDNNSNSGDND